jgi:hypothetical protein
MARKIEITDALVKLVPEARWMCRGETYSDIVWMDSDIQIPTEEELLAEVARQQAEIDAVQYIEDRKKTYPSVGDFADAMYWASKGDPSKLDEYYAACEAVKLQYPKPE